jgi:hypothetical protein
MEYQRERERERAEKRFGRLQFIILSISAIQSVHTCNSY